MWRWSLWVCYSTNQGLNNDPWCIYKIWLCTCVLNFNYWYVRVILPSCPCSSCMYEWIKNFGGSQNGSHACVITDKYICMVLTLDVRICKCPKCIQLIRCASPLLNFVDRMYRATYYRAQIKCPPRVNRYVWMWYPNSGIFPYKLQYEKKKREILWSTEISYNLRWTGIIELTTGCPCVAMDGKAIHQLEFQITPIKVMLNNHWVSFF